MDDPDIGRDRKAATWVTAAVLASVAAPILAKTQKRASSTATAGASAVPGPVAGDAISEEYARLVARQTYFWAWPLVNVYNRWLAMQRVPRPRLNKGVLAVASPNRPAMLRNHFRPQVRHAAYPNCDVIDGCMFLDLRIAPAIVQIPDFGRRFWVYQAVDLRTDSFASLGKMYGSRPGFYLLAGPDWHGQAPKGIRQMFRSPTSVGMLIPRVFMDDTPEDLAVVQSLIRRIGVYPLADYDGEFKETDWPALRGFDTAPSVTRASAEQTPWVDPNRFWDVLPAVLDEAPPQHGEEALYMQARALIAAARHDEAIRSAVVDEATKAEADLIAPLSSFNLAGKRLPGNWNTLSNGAAFGMDYYSRTAMAASHIFINKANEIKCFYSDTDASGQRLDGSGRYTLTFHKDRLPAVKSFWSLTLYDSQHFLCPNPRNRYTLGTKDKALKFDPDGSLTLKVQNARPGDETSANWLPAPASEAFTLYLRAYWPQQALLDGEWTPPPIVREV